MGSEMTVTGFYCNFLLPSPVSPEGFEKIKANMKAPAEPCVFELYSFSGIHSEEDIPGKFFQRIYVLAFATDRELREHKEQMKLASEADHRKIGAQLSLFSGSGAIGQGLVLWHPKGAMVRVLLEQYQQQMNISNGYSWVFTPHIGKARLWEISGHLENFSEDMYSPLEIDNEKYYLKPMNCPFHISIYNSEPRSYRDLPIRYAEYGTVYRYEMSGTLHGLTRVRGFTQDDAHIFCSPEQIEMELTNTLKLSLHTLSSFGLSGSSIYISTRPEKKAIGSNEQWEVAINILKKAVRNLGLSYDIDEGGGAFYGPKIDIKLLDSLGRDVQCSTIQLDFNLPGRFGMSYMDRDGQFRTPYMIHRALFGSIERFMALLTEHHKGDFLFWLAPVQVGIVPVRPSHSDYCRRLKNKLMDNGIRAEVNNGDMDMRDKIKGFSLEMIPYVFVAGDRDMEASAFFVRSRKNGKLGQMKLEEFLSYVEPELNEGKAKRVLD
jgi:threonyl-tRNA synthetase